MRSDGTRAAAAVAAVPTPLAPFPWLTPPPAAAAFRRSHSPGTDAAVSSRRCRLRYTAAKRSTCGVTSDITISTCVPFFPSFPSSPPPPSLRRRRRSMSEGGVSRVQ